MLFLSLYQYQYKLDQWKVYNNCDLETRHNICVRY